MKKTLGIKHIALKVKNFKDCLNFYTNLLEMKIDWQPDDENAYLTNGRDNLALHMDESLDLKSKHNRLDHFGIMMKEKDDVDDWFKFISSKNIFKIYTSSRYIHLQHIYMFKIYTCSTYIHVQHIYSLYTLHICQKTQYPSNIGPTYGLFTYLWA